MFKEGEIYSMYQMSKGEFRAAFDGFYAVIGDSVDELSMWLDSEMSEIMAEDKSLSEEEAYKQAKEYVLDNIGTAYEGARDIAVFEGIAPVQPGKAFDFYTDYKCIKVVKEGGEYVK